MSQNNKGQGAILDFLFTYGYGWVILVIIIVGIVIWQLGIFPPPKYSGEECLIACKQIYPQTTEATPGVDNLCSCYVTKCTKDGNICGNRKLINLINIKELPNEEEPSVLFQTCPEIDPSMFTSILVGTETILVGSNGYCFTQDGCELTLVCGEVGDTDCYAGCNIELWDTGLWDDHQRATEIATAHLSCPTTLIEVKKLECPGCFSITLQRDDNQKQFTITLNDWKITQNA